MIFKILFSILIIHTPNFQTTYDIENNIGHHIYKRDNFDWLNHLKPAQEAVSEIYDFIIVGAGSAGSVIANRLSEVHDWKILVLEVGEEEKYTEMPLTVSLLQFTKYNWRYFMERQPGIALACENQRMPWPKGKALGGTSVINYMIYTRGQRFDFDKWAAQGNPGWSYKDILPYYIKSENTALKNNVDYRYHGVQGYLRTEDAYQSEISNAFINGLNELEIPIVDYNANKSLGVSTIQGTTSEGKRLSAARAFLHSVNHRPNLRILTEAFVTKLLINRETKEAYGVEYERFGVSNRVGASKEVILSAGTFGSPQLLILAGIGPKEHLEELGIPVLKNLQVGRNLQDHFAFLGLSFSTNQYVTHHFSQLLNPYNILNFYINGMGPLTGLGGAQAIAYIKTSQSKEPADDPDIELLFIGTSLAFDFGLVIRRGMGITDKIYNAVFGPLEKTYSLMIIPLLLHPKSKGYLKLRSKDPHDYPLFYGNYLTDSGNEDIDTLLASIRYVQRLAQTKAFAKFNVTFNTNPVPGCERHKFDSDPYWKCCLRFLGQTLHHQVGTVKMGPSEDPEAVVNNELQVHGIGRLRVADCSVIPFAIAAHTSAPAMMVGEKAADLIKTTWNKQ
ncbi:GMC oxred N domain containing protein [Asbolus verrucosus]|uniref:GMC oxred N domain containing protein n=1 Tax=Asbolus verrucosus TaxID=1661398 RepID=A0A482VIT3_ASBVE|nr:GMC oxred N domain containing protein [Asbolus verrucosus]